MTAADMLDVKAPGRAYEPRPGTVAGRTVAYLRTLEHGAEVRGRDLAAAIGVPMETLPDCLEAAARHGLVFCRQLEEGRTAPLYWSLVDHSGGDDEGAALSFHTVYLTPLGRRCRLLEPLDANAPRAFMVYDLPGGRPALREYSSEGFMVTRENFHILRRVRQ